MADTQLLPTGVFTAPGSYTVPNALSATLETVFAHFDGTSATSPWVPTLELVSDSGHTIGIVPMDGPVQAGAACDATWSIGLNAGLQAKLSQKFLLVSAATTNATLVSAGAHELTGYALVNNGASFAYVKLYDVSSAPTVGTTTPVAVLPVPPSSGANVSFPEPVLFTSGIGLGITGGIANSDTTAVSSNQVSVTLFYQ